MNKRSFAADHELIRALEKHSVPVACEEGCTLFSQNEAPKGLYVLQSGEAVLLMKSPKGKPVLCLRAAENSLLGLPAVIGNQPYTLTAMVRAGSKVRFVSSSDFEDTMRADPSMSFKVLQMVANEVRTARLALTEL